jgi:transcriptional regulator with GAF, ATPase, and Fis domain
VIDRAAILGNGHRLDVAKSLGFSAPRPPRAAEPAVTMYEVVPEESLVVADSKGEKEDSDQEIVTLDEAMKKHIERALVATRGRVEGSNGAAKLLDINPHTLRARMRKLDIPWSQFRQY